MDGPIGRHLAERVASRSRGPHRVGTSSQVVQVVDRWRRSAITPNPLQRLLHLIRVQMTPCAENGERALTSFLVGERIRFGLVEEIADPSGQAIPVRHCNQGLLWI